MGDQVSSGALELSDDDLTFTRPIESAAMRLSEPLNNGPRPLELRPVACCNGDPADTLPIELLEQTIRIVSCSKC